MMGFAANHNVADQTVSGSRVENTRLSSPALSVKNLSKSFGDGQVKVFQNISFDIAAGDAVALIGANGTGKSTLLRSCVGLVPVDSGEVLIGDQSVHNLSAAKLRICRSKIGFIFQKHNLVPRLTVLTNVLHGGLARGVGMRAWFHALAPDAEREKAMNCLEQVGLAHLADRHAGQLSGGQSQRVAIARALMQDPHYLFADEPVASLDPVAGDGIMELFERLNKEHHITLVFVSHHVDHALKYSRRILGLRNGALELDVDASTQTPQMLRELYV